MKNPTNLYKRHRFEEEKAVAILRSVTLEQAMATAGGIPFSWRHLGISVLEAIVAVHMTFVCLVAGQSLLDRANKAMRLVADSSYWVYIIHLPVLFMIQYLLLDVNWNLWIKFACSSLGTLAIGFVSYLLLVRWTPIGWLLNGRRRQSVAAGVGDVASKPGLGNSPV